MYIAHSHNIANVLTGMSLTGT